MAKATNIHNIILTGDLNSDLDTPNGRKLINFCNTNILTLHIDKPTRITGDTATCLDQIITNIPNFVKECKISPPISNCDHCVVSAKLLFRRKLEPTYNRHIWDYEKANFEHFRNYLNSLDWETCFQYNDVDACCNEWTKRFINAAEYCIPNKNITVRIHDLPWYNSHLRCLKRKVNRLFCKAKSKPRGHIAWTNYNRIRNDYHEQLENAESQYNNKLSATLQNSKRRNKSWWRTVKYFLNKNHSSSIPSLLCDDKHISDNASKAEAFNSFFLSQCRLDEIHPRPLHLPKPPLNCITELKIGEQEVLDILKSLDVSKASGPDGVSCKLLKEAAPSIYRPLTKLINMSLEKRVFPTEWKKANVTPFFKRGSENAVNNYRPISLLSCTGKVMERVIFKHVFNFFRTNSLISSNQSGFIPGDSTINQLLLLYHELCLVVDHRKKFESYSSTLVRHLTKYGTPVYYSN